MEIIGLFFLGFLCFFLVWLIEEDLNSKFVKVGVFNKLTYSDFVKKVRNPNEIIHKNGFIVARWSCSNFMKQSYHITLVFDGKGNFVKCHEQGFGGGMTITPMVWVKI
jgi:hypothetical protein